MKKGGTKLAVFVGLRIRDQEQIVSTAQCFFNRTKLNSMKQLTFFFALVTMISCGQASDRNITTTPASIDSLTAAFLSGWNNRDSAAIMKTIADNAIVMNDSLIHRGHSAIAGNWVSGGVKVLSNIKTTSLIKDSDSRIAYDGGTYTCDLTIPGGPVLKEKGNYNLVWTKQQNGDWKLTLIHIEDITRMPDIQ